MTGSSHTCLELAIDGSILTGGAIVYKFALAAVSVNLTTSPGSTSYLRGQIKSGLNTEVASQGVEGDKNIGCIIQVETMNATDAAFALLSGSEFVADSYLLGISTTTSTGMTEKKLVKGTWGQVNSFMGLNYTDTDDTALTTSAWTHIVWVSTLGSKSRAGTATLSTITATIDTDYWTDTTNRFDTGLGININAPSGGIAQFKGLTVGTTAQAKYVQMRCIGVQPFFATAATWHSFAVGTGNSYMFTCLTGISQCGVSIADGTTALVAADNTACLADPRYQTWRMVTLKYTLAGALTWYRTDSYWNAADAQTRSTWGPALKISAHPLSKDDNSGDATAAAAENGRTYVYAMADGSGVQLVHLSFGTTRGAAATAGSGANALTAAPAGFTNSSPNRAEENRCGTSNLNLVGTADISALADAIKEHSDGYVATLAIALEYFNGGAAGSWRGVCMVWYSSQFIQDATNGAMCAAAQQNGGAGSGPFDFKSISLMHVANTAWAPPAASASVSPANALSDAKYGIAALPAAATAAIYTEGNWASVAWYQPKSSATYTLMARYGAKDYAGAYCMQGSGTTSYFTAPKAAIELSGAFALATGVALGAAALTFAF